MNFRMLGAAVAACLVAAALQAKDASDPPNGEAAASASDRPPHKVAFNIEGWAPKRSVALTKCSRQTVAPGVECRIKTTTERGIATCYDGVVKSVDEKSVRLVARGSRVCRSYDVPLIFIGFPTTLRTGWCEDWKSVDEEEITIAKDRIWRAWLLKDKEPDGTHSVGPSLSIRVD